MKQRAISLAMAIIMVLSIIFSIPVSAANSSVISFKSGTTFFLDEGLIRGAWEKTGVVDFLDSIISTNNITILDASGKKKEKGVLATGDVVDSQSEQYIVIIDGDVNGDGRLDAFDYQMLKAHVLGTFTITEYNLIAADTNSSKGVDAFDYQMLKAHVLGTYNLFIKYEPKDYPVGHEHSYKASVTQPTCTSKGFTTNTCEGCGHVYIDAYTDALGHDWEQATCSAPKTCKRCLVTEGTPAPHVYNLEVVKQDALKSSATSTTAAVYYKSCKCGKISSNDSDTFTFGAPLGNDKAIIYKVVNEAEHPYLATLNIDMSKLKYSYTPGQTLTLVNLELGKYGYTFDGWYDGFGKNATQIKEIPASATEDITVYAHVTENVYDITYNMYQTPVSSSPETEQLHYTVSKGNSNLYYPEINNYLFLGWYDNDGVEYKTIPIGTTGHITLNAYYTSLRNLAVSIEDDNPIILEDQNNNVVYFTYEIGEIRNIPLNADKPFWEIQSVAGLSQQNEETKEIILTKTEADSISKTISDMTVNSSTWTLSENWNDVISVDETWAESIGKEAEQCITDSTTASNTLSITNQMGGSSYHKTEDGTTVYDYDSKTETKDKGHQFNASISGTYTNKLEANIGVSNEYGVEESLGYTSKTKGKEQSASASDKDTLSAGVKYENGFEATAGLSYGYHNNTTTVTKTGTDKVSNTSHIDEETSSWNNSETFSTSLQHSSSESVRNTLSDIVTTTKGYGSSYSNGGSDTNSQGFSSTASNTSGTTSTVTYSKLESKKTTVKYSVDGKIEGKYRRILVGKAHVFAVVGYDYATRSFFTYTFSIMDDKIEEFLDYTPKGGDFTDCENSCLPFEIPFFVFEYVNQKTAKTKNIQYVTNSLNGTARITNYTGTDSDVIIPTYVSDGKQSYKVTEISKNAFAGKPIRSIVLGDYVKSIPDGAFKNCTNLEEISGSFTEIGNEAFAGCTKLTNLIIPSNVVKIGKNAFRGVQKISVRAINSLCAYIEALKILPDASDEQAEKAKKEYTLGYIQSVLDSGAENIILDLSKIADNTAVDLEVPEINSITIAGGMRTFNDFSLSSKAKETSLSEITINNDRKIPLTIDSDSVVLHKVFATANSTVLVLKKNGAIVTLVQDSAVQTNSKYALLAPNITFESQVSSSGAVGSLVVSGDLGYVDTIFGEDYVIFSNGDLKKITETEFNKYANGAFRVLFDSNGGTKTSEILECFLGSSIEKLPAAPRKDYYSFEGWFTEKNGGSKVQIGTLADDIYSGGEDVVLYAHWKENPISEWIKATDAPADALIVDRKYTYTLREYKEGDSSSMSGWIFYEKERVGWSSWSTEDPDKWSTEDPSNGERDVESKKQWHYYRWTNSSYSAVYASKRTSGEYICTVYEERWFDYELSRYTPNSGAGVMAEKGHENIPHDWKYVWIVAYDNEHTGDKTWTRTVYRYRDPIYSYKFYRDLTEQESVTDPTGRENVSNVVEYVRYRAK